VPPYEALSALRWNDRKSCPAQEIRNTIERSFLGHGGRWPLLSASDPVGI